MHFLTHRKPFLSMLDSGRHQKRLVRKGCAVQFCIIWAIIAFLSPVNLMENEYISAVNAQN